MSENQPGESQAVPGPDLGSGSGLMMIGAAIVVVGWVVFSVIMGEFTFSAVFLAVATIVLMGTRNIGGMTLGDSTLRLLGYFMGLVGAFLLVSDLRFGFPDGFADNVANIVFYVGCLLMFLGARGLPTRS